MQRKLLFISLVGGILLALGSIVLAFVFGLTFGNVSGLLGGSLMIAAYFFYPELSKRLRKCFNICLIAGVLFFAVAICFLFIQGNKNTATFVEDSVLVLGCGIRGETILPLLQDRLDKCVEYHRKNPTAIIIVSGGQGRNEDIPEAEAMKRYLVGHGVDENRILEENKSRDTEENMLFSKRMLDNHFRKMNKCCYTTVCITSNYHAYRGRQLATSAGFCATNYNAGIRWYLAPSAYFREVLSVCKYYFEIL